MRNYITNFIAVFGVLSFMSCSALASEFQAIADVDLAFLLIQPKLPWVCDPFEKRPGFVAITGAQEKFVLAGIVWSDDDDPMAVINGKVVVEGDTVGDRSVASIGKNYVVLDKGDSSIELVSPPLESAPKSATETPDTASTEDNDK